MSALHSLSKNAMVQAGIESKPIYKSAVVSRIGQALLILLLVLFSQCAAAQIPVLGSGEESATETEAPVGEASVAVQPKPATAPVIVDGETLFVLRGLSAYPAEERAAKTAEKIIAAAEDEALSVDSLRLEEKEDHHSIYIGKHLLMDVIDADARLEGVERNILAEVKLGAIREAIASYRRDRTASDLAYDIVKAIGGTGLFFLLILGLRWITRKVRELFESRYKTRLEEVEVKSRKLLRVEQVGRTMLFFLRVLLLTVALVAFYIYVNTTLSLFPWTRAVGNELLDYLIMPLISIGKGILGFLPDLIFLVILFYIVKLLLQALQGFFSTIARGEISFVDFEPEWAWPTYRIVRVVVLIFALVVAYPYIPGSESEAFKALGIFLGVLLSLGSSSFMANIIAGYLLTYRRAFKKGDIVQIGEVIGEVVDMRLLETHIHTPKNEGVVLPNTTITNGQVINFSKLAKQKGLVLHTTVSIGYEVPCRQVEALLIMAAKRTKGMLTTREPFVLHKNLGDFGIQYEINVYSDKPQNMPTLYSNLHRNIEDVFNEYGVSIMTPAYVADPQTPKSVPK